MNFIRMDFKCITVRRLCLAALGSLVIAVTGCATTSTQPAANPVELVDEVWAIVNDHFYDPNFNGIDWPAAREEAIRAATSLTDPADEVPVVRDMLALLRTSHTAYYTERDRAYYDLLDIFAAQFGEFIEKRFGDGGVRYEGIGIITRNIDDRWHIVDVLPWTAAASAGLLVGDEVVSVDGAGYEPIESFRSKAGQRISIAIRRRSALDDIRLFNITVGWIQPAISYEKSTWYSRKIVPVDGRRIAYVRVRSYAGERMHDAVVRAVTGDSPLAAADALVLDLRGGWGGANPGNLDLFNDDVPPLTFLPRGDSPRTIDNRWRKPVVLLVDGDTRSGKEIFAYAFQKHQLGTIVGTRTAGAVVGGRPFLLSDGSMLYLAVQDVLVNGVRLEGRGVVPDVEATLNFSYLQGADPQLDAALRIAAERVALD